MPIQKASFAREVKEEIAKANWSDQAKRALLSAFIRLKGKLLSRPSGDWLFLAGGNLSIGQSVARFIYELYGLKGELESSPGGEGYRLCLSEADYLLGELAVDFSSPKIPKSLVARDSGSSAYLAGAFLSSGSLNDPVSSNYHLEFSFPEPLLAKWFCRFLARCRGGRFHPKTGKRRSQALVYLKRSDEISELLAYMGASSSCLKFENVRIDRDFQNLDNRLYNIDSANLRKSLQAGERQIKEIQALAEKGGWEGEENPKLRALMRLRLAHPEASLGKLAALLSEEISESVSKSGVNHLFRALHREYLRLDGK